NMDVHSIARPDIENAPIGMGPLPRPEPGYGPDPGAGSYGSYQLVDLYSEGLPGILTEQGNGWFYKTHLSSGHFTPARLVRSRSSLSGLDHALQLTELEADGVKQIVHWGAEPKGFFELNDNDEWQPFRPFESIPAIDLTDPNARLLDLNGDGIAALL